MGSVSSEFILDFMVVFTSSGKSRRICTAVDIADFRGLRSERGHNLVQILVQALLVAS